MKTFTVLASASAVALVLATQPAVAQTSGGSSIVLTDHSVRSSKLIGSPVINEQGQMVGKIIDVLVKHGATEPLVILSVGDFVGRSSKLVAAPLSHIKVEKAELMMPGATKQAIAQMPAYPLQGLEGGGG